MPLQKQYWEMVFGQSGRMKRTDEKVLESPNLSELINGEIVNPGKIQKRHGYVSLESDQTDDYGLSVGTRTAKGASITAIGDYAVKDYNPTTEWVGEPVSLLASSTAKTLLGDAKHVYSQPDIAYYNGFYYVAFTDTVASNSYDRLYVYDSNWNFVAKTSASNYSYPVKVIVVNGAILYFYRSSNTLYCSVVNQSDFSLGGGTPITTTLHATAYYYDVTTDGTYAYVVYSANTNAVALATVDNTGTLISSVGKAGYGAADKAIAVKVSGIDSTKALVVFCNSSNGIYFGVRDLSGGTWDTEDTIGSVVENIVIIDWTSSTLFAFAVQHSGSTTIESYVSIYTIDFTTVESVMLGSGIIHKSIMDLTDRYTDNQVNPLYGLCRQQDDFCVLYTAAIKPNYTGSPYPSRSEPIAKYLYRIASGIGKGACSGGAVSALISGYEDNTYYFVTIDIEDNVILCSFDYASTGDAFQRRFSSVRVGNELLIAGSVPIVFDGVIAKEIGFSHPPYITDDTVAGSGNIADGTYNYIIVYKISDNNGRVYRSLISVPYEVVVSGGSGVASVEIEFLPAIHRPGWVDGATVKRCATAELYRTEDSGTVYYKVAEIDALNDHAWFAYEGGASPPTITDTLADGSITSNAYIYTTGNVLEQCAPPPLDDICYYDNRVWGIDSETGDIPYSAEIIEGEGIWFNSTFVVKSPANIGKPIALVETQSFILVFYKGNIGAIYGQGYNNLGVDGNLTSVKILASGIGCAEKKSIIKTPAGIIFKADSGFHLMGYDGSMPQYIGGGVSDYDSSNVVSADIIQDKKHVRFVLSATGDPILVYNYEFNQWYVWGYDIGGTWCTKTGGCVIDNVHYLVNGDTGNTLIQDSGYLDGIIEGTYSENYYVFSITTPWIKLTGLQGFQRVLKAWILGTFESDHDMVVDIDYDYDDSNTDTVTITDLSSEIGEDLYQVRIGITKQRCQAIRFKITIDTGSYAEGAGATLTGLRLEYMAKRGGMRSANFGSSSGGVPS